MLTNTWISTFSVDNMTQRCKSKILPVWWEWPVSRVVGSLGDGSPVLPQPTTFWLQMTAGFWWPAIWFTYPIAVTYVHTVDDAICLRCKYAIKNVNVSTLTGKVLSIWNVELTNNIVWATETPEHKFALFEGLSQFPASSGQLPSKY